MIRCAVVLVALLGVVGFRSPTPALAQPDPSGIDFVTVGAPGNAPWTGGGSNNGRGQVDYEYRIGRFEVTTAQWAEFMNAAFDRPATDRIPHVFAPLQWGAVGTTPNTPGGRRWAVPAGREMIPTGGVDWRTCAIYANWLHNGKGTNREAFLSGAYDVSTFGYIGDGGGFTDQLTRSPGARYWIPSLDEWMKASHFDANKVNPDGTRGGWWQYGNSSDTPMYYGPPGVRVSTGRIPGPDPNGPLATANGGWENRDFPGFNAFNINLGAYAMVVSPWGLLDVAGGTSEWTEGYFQNPGEPVPRDRLFDGTAWGTSTSGLPDTPGYYRGGEAPSLAFYDFGLRIASNVPSPGIGSLGLGGLLLSLALRRRRKHESEDVHRIAPGPLGGDCHRTGRADRVQDQ